MQLILISLGPSLTTGPQRSWAANMARFSWWVFLFHSIQAGEKEDVKWALGILDKGDSKTGKMMYWYARKRSREPQAIRRREIILETLQ